MGALQRVIILLYCVLIASADQLCTATKECVGQALNDNSTFVLNYKGAYGPSTSFSGDEIECKGSHSCDSMKFMRVHSNGICRGSDSCSNTTIYMEDIATNIYCHASYSCAFSSITPVTTVDGPLVCSGYLSCRNAYIYNVAHIKGEGALSLYRSIINTINSTESVTEIDLEGSLAGFGGKLICKENHTCNIKCRSLDACYMFYTECIGECIITECIGECILPITNITQYNNVNMNMNIPRFFNLQAAVISNDDVCIMETWNFDDYNEHKGIDITVNNHDQGPICCRGLSACEEINEIIFETTTNNDLICSGYSSCRSSNIISNNGTVYCQAQSACYGSSIISAHILYCTGGWACFEASIFKVNHILCLGHDGCRYATFMSNGSDLNVYFAGRESGSGVVLYCNDTDSCTIFCSGWNSCYGITLVCNDNCKMECDGVNALCPIIIDAYTSTKYPSLSPIETLTTIYRSMNPSETLYSTTQYPSFHRIDTTVYPAVSSMQTSYASLSASEPNQTPFSSANDGALTTEISYFLSGYTSRATKASSTQTLSSPSMIAYIIICASTLFVLIMVCVCVKICYDGMAKKRLEQSVISINAEVADNSMNADANNVSMDIGTDGEKNNEALDNVETCNATTISAMKQDKIVLGIISTHGDEYNICEGGNVIDNNMQHEIKLKETIQ